MNTTNMTKDEKTVKFIQEVDVVLSPACCKLYYYQLLLLESLTCHPVAPPPSPRRSPTRPRASVSAGRTAKCTTCSASSPLTHHSHFKQLLLAHSLSVLLWTLLRLLTALTCLSMFDNFVFNYPICIEHFLSVSEPGRSFLSVCISCFDHTSQLIYRLLTFNYFITCSLTIHFILWAKTKDIIEYNGRCLLIFLLQCIVLYLMFY